MASQIDYTYDPVTGADTASVTVSWTPVSVAEDGSQIDIQGYAVERSTDGVTWFALRTVGPDLFSTTITGVQVPSEFWVRVRVLAANGQASTPSEAELITLVSDITPPPVPSTPSASVRLGVVSVTWNGLFDPSDTPPVDFDGVQVHVSQTSGFTPDASTMRARLFEQSSAAIGGLAYGTWYVRLVSVDRRGNTSAPSAQQSVAVEALVVTDSMISELNGNKIITGTVGSTQIEDGGITTPKIATKAVNTDNIASGAVTTAKLDAFAVTTDKIAANAVTSNTIQAGAIDGMVITGATFRTGSSGARIEFTSAGIRQYNGSNVVISEWTPTAFTLTGGTITGATVQTGISAPFVRLNPTAGIRRGIGVEVVGSAGWLNPAGLFLSPDNSQMQLFGPQTQSDRTTYLSASGDTWAMLSRINTGQGASMQGNTETVSMNVTDSFGNSTSVGVTAGSLTMAVQGTQVFAVNSAGTALFGTTNIRPTAGGIAGWIDTVAANNVRVYSPVLNLEAASTGSITFKTTDVTRRRFVLTDSAQFAFGSMIFRDQADTVTTNTNSIGINSATDFNVSFNANGQFAVTKNGVGGSPTLLITGNGASAPDYQFRSLQSSTGTANVMVAGAGTQNALRYISSNAADKLDRIQIGLMYELLEMPAYTWRDRSEVEDNPNAWRRYAGTTVQALNALSQKYDGKFDSLITWNDDKTPQSVAYDRLFPAFMPTVGHMNNRLGATEAAILDIDRRLAALEQNGTNA